MTFRYSLYGFAIASDLELPHLAARNDSASPEIVIQRGTVGAGRDEVERRDGGLVLTIPTVARFFVRDGTSIIVDADAEADERDVRLFLTGSAMGIALMQHGRLALHGNAVVIDGRAWIFSGPSGSGKSTLAAWLAKQGYGVLADDVAAIEFAGERPVVLSGLPRLRLWDDAILGLGDDPARHPLSYFSEERVCKRDFAMDGTATAKAPLEAITFIEEGTLALRELQGIEAAQLLIENLYRGEWLPLTADGNRTLAAVATVVSEVRVFRLTRPKGEFAQIGEFISLLNESLRR